MMASIWRFLSGEVPGGFAVPLVLIIAFYPVLEYVYRSGDTMRAKTYKRWRWLGPVLILAVYALFWFQAPPKFEPLRLAVVTNDQAAQMDWRALEITDLTSRCLQRSLEKALVNPWDHAAAEYPPPSVDNLKRARYRVYLLAYKNGLPGNDSSFQLTSPDGEVRSFSAASADLRAVSREIALEILKDIGKKPNVAEPFNRAVGDDELAFYYQGLQALAAGRTNASRQYLSRALALDSTWIPVMIAEARAIEMSGDINGAEAAFIQLIQRHQAADEVMLTAGEFFLRIEAWDKAEAPLKVALSRNPLAVRAYYGLSQLHPERLKDLRLNTPIALLKEAVRLDPAFERARLALATRLSKTPVGYQAFDILKKGLLINPQSEELWLKWGALKLYNGDSEEAAEAYQKILAFDPQNAAAAFNLGVVAYRTDRFNDAEGYFRQSLQWGGSPDNYYYLGLIYRKNGDSDRAKKYFLKRWEMRSSDEDVYAVKAKEYADALP